MSGSPHKVNGRDSAGRRLGVKIYGGAAITTGAIILRQRGTNFFPGRNVSRAKDDTLFATADGTVQFGYSKGGKRSISVIPKV